MALWNVHQYKYLIHRNVLRRNKVPLLRGLRLDLRMLPDPLRLRILELNLRRRDIPPQCSAQTGLPLGVSDQRTECRPVGESGQSIRQRVIHLAESGVYVSNTSASWSYGWYGEEGGGWCDITGDDQP